MKMIPLGTTEAFCSSPNCPSLGVKLPISKFSRVQGRAFYQHRCNQCRGIANKKKKEAAKVYVSKKDRGLE